SMTIQPSEFAKFATSLAIAKFISDMQTNIKTLQDQLKAVGLLMLPALLILLQNDTGSTVVYAAFFFVFYREGLQQIYLIIAVTIILLAIVTLKFVLLTTVITAGILIFGYHFFGRKKKPQLIESIVISLLCIGFSFGVKYFYESVLKPHQQDRISLWLRLESDPERLKEMKQTILYNLNESEKAISSGGLTGKGF